MIILKISQIQIVSKYLMLKQSHNILRIDRDKFNIKRFKISNIYIIMSNKVLSGQSVRWNGVLPSSGTMNSKQKNNSNEHSEQDSYHHSQNYSYNQCITSANAIHLITCKITCSYRYRPIGRTRVLWKNLSPKN